MRILVLLALATTLVQPPPDTEVFLAPMSSEGGSLAVGRPENISNSPGYDNQPSFSPDGSAVFFTSARGTAAGAAEPQMDIYRFDVSAKRFTQITGTPESEYSPTVMHDGRHISVVRVEADKTQRLWKFPLAGGKPSLVLPDVKPVGYHAWLDADTVALFVLGERSTLQVASIRTGKTEVVASDIGRSLQPMPGGGISYVQHAGERDGRTMTIMRMTIEDGKPVTQPLTAVAPGAAEEFVAWTPDGTLLMAGGNHLYSWRRGDAEWRRLADLAALGLRSVSRIAVSPDGKDVAFVATASR